MSQIVERMERLEAERARLKEKRRERMYELLEADEHERWLEERKEFDREIAALESEIVRLGHEHRSMRRNPAMTARFGKEVAPPSSLSKAERIYRTFHQKDPRRVVQLNHRIPTKVGKAGELISVSYRTDKWHDDGHDVDYKHVDDPGVFVYEPWGAQSWLEEAKLPRRPPSENEGLALLGKHLGYYIRRVGDGEVLEATPRNTYLFCAPDGKMLFVYHPKRGFLAIMAGGRLSVRAEGIDG